ncbi:MAG: glycogen debranching protein GlgX [Anaerolineae bacterium]|nr:glycogen debranching protein GlgX [Anaerolineae bacterium]
MERIDVYPTHEHAGYHLRRGYVQPFGATLVPGGINFSIFSSHATAVILVLYERGEKKPLVEIPFRDEFRIGNVWAMVVFGINYENLEYGYRMDGPYNPPQGHRFNPQKVLLDPYAKVISGRDVWGVRDRDYDDYSHRSRPTIDDFDWEDDRPLEIPIEDMVIYEMHVRGLTRHPSSGVKNKGTYAAIRRKIPYLKELGINCVELMPIFEFDELENDRKNPRTGERLYNYWGYSTVGFFAPKAGYAATGGFGMQVDEFKNLVKELHANGIEVWLDVVFNHTAEGNEKGPTISFRGIDNQTYYMLDSEGRYLNFSGTGNTLNCNHPVVRNIVLDALRYWAAEYHIDGFRFDLASILGRDQDGHPLPNPPLLEQLAFDPVLAKCKLIAEAWDAGGLYQVGSFPAYGRWAEWNGRYRDTLRRFIKGDEDTIWNLGQSIQGSPDLYEISPTDSINFITCHDGFTLMDLVSYNHKHNYENGEDGRDGANDNNSWNCGHEGLTQNQKINHLRRQQMKNAIAILMVSQGVPMIFMGDEIARSKGGNNNTYCHDSELTWLDWNLLDENQDMFRFFKLMIDFRKRHPVLRNRHHFLHQDIMGTGYPDISFHGVDLWQPDWGAGSHSLAFMLSGAHAREGREDDNDIYVAMNAYWDALDFQLPPLDGKRWHLVVDTVQSSSDDIYPDEEEPLLRQQDSIQLAARSVVILIGK